MPQDGDDIAQKNKWSHNTIVEIYSPKNLKMLMKDFFMRWGRSMI